MIQSVLLAVDASPAAQVAATYALFLCHELAGSLEAVYVADRRLFHRVYGEEYLPPGEPTNPYFHEIKAQLEAQGRALLEHVRHKAEQVGVPCQTELRTGLPDIEILSAARGCDLIVLGRYGESALLRAHRRLGAVAERVVRGAHQPVLVAGEGFFAFSRVLLGYDGSERARKAMIYAAELAARLTIPMLAVCVDDNETVAEQHLETVRAYDEAHRVELTARALRGDPVAAILGEAKGGDLIAMGAFGEGRIRERLLGSTTQAVLETTVQPILLHR